MQNLIGGGSQGVVIMGGNISHVTVHHPAPPVSQNPTKSEEEERQERARDAAYRRFLATLPEFRPRSVQLRRVRRNVYEPTQRAYAVADVNAMLDEIRKLIAAQDLRGLSAYLAAVGLNKVTETSQPTMALSEGLPVDVYLYKLRDALRACFAETEDP